MPHKKNETEDAEQSGGTHAGASSLADTGALSELLKIPRQGRQMYTRGRAEDFGAGRHHRPGRAKN